MESDQRYQSFRDFYPYYLSEHSNSVCRGLHYVGTLLALTIWIYAIATGNYWLILAGVVTGYAFAWTGHYFFEHNKPATFQYPLWSFMGDWVMLKDFLTGKIQAAKPD